VCYNIEVQIIIIIARYAYGQKATIGSAGIVCGDNGRSGAQDAGFYRIAYGSDLFYGMTGRVRPFDIPVIII
jgi:hypothetical protein